MAPQERAVPDEAGPPTDARGGALEQYQHLYRIGKEDLAPGVPGERSESEVIQEAALDYDRDRPRAFQIQASECALIVVDMQEEFVRPGGPMWVPQAERIVPAIRSLAEVCRSLLIPVFFTAATYVPGYPNDTERFCEPVSQGHLAFGSPGAAIVPELLAPGEYVVDAKHTYDAFWGTDLDGRLRAQGTRTVIISGTLTNYCCEATARGAFDRGYHVVFGSDLTATDTAAGHLATLRTMRRGYARVLARAEIERALRHGDLAFGP